MRRVINRRNTSIVCRKMQSPAGKYISNFVVDNFYGGKVLKDVVAACLQSETLVQIEDFMKSNAGFFTDDEEHKLVYAEIFGKYCELIENLLEEPLRKHKTTVESFMELCGKLHDSMDDKNVQVFLDLLLTITKYEFFAELMLSSEKRDYYFYILKGWQEQTKRAQRPSARSGKK